MSKRNNPPVFMPGSSSTNMEWLTTAHRGTVVEIAQKCIINCGSLGRVFQSAKTRTETDTTPSGQTASHAAPNISYVYAPILAVAHHLCLRLPITCNYALNIYERMSVTASLHSTIPLHPFLSKQRLKRPFENSYTFMVIHCQCNTAFPFGIVRVVIKLLRMYSCDTWQRLHMASVSRRNILNYTTLPKRII